MKNLDLEKSAENLSPKLQASMFSTLFTFEAVSKTNYSL